MDEHIGIIKGIEREIAGTIAGVPADDDFEPCVMEPPRILRCLALEAGRELEGDLLSSPLPQLADKIRDSA
jgi:hypothetical protein